MRYGCLSSRIFDFRLQTATTLSRLFAAQNSMLWKNVLVWWGFGGVLVWVCVGNYGDLLQFIACFKIF